MPTDAPVYRRLTRPVAGVASYSSMWVAADHLLLVTSTGYAETYSRVMFKDIKGVFVAPTDRRMWWLIGWGVLGAVTGIRAALVLTSADVPFVSLPLFLLSLVAVLVNTALGAGCRVGVATAVQTATLPSLVRRKKADRILAELEPLILAAQSHLAAKVPGTTDPVGGATVAPAEPTA